MTAYPFDQSSLQERAAYQAAICLKSLGRREEAIRAFDALLARPPSPQIRKGCTTYLLALRKNGLTRQESGWLAKVDERQVASLQAAAWARAACGPQSLTRVLQRYDAKVAWKTLAHEAGMSREGTTLLALARCARKRGFSAVGLQVLPDELHQQRKPVLALLRRSHFVVVEKADRKGIRCWDPMGIRKDYSPEQWLREWDGYLLAVRPRT
ncbi:MAG: hypothetical protein IT210_10310 [Armatimonadetes bacterium]|nr:hypothetical protein [Armatimonadota bacterium]